MHVKYSHQSGGKLIERLAATLGGWFHDGTEQSLIAGQDQRAAALDDDDLAEAVELTGRKAAALIEQDNDVTVLEVVDYSPGAPFNVCAQKNNGLPSYVEDIKVNNAGKVQGGNGPAFRGPRR